MSTDILKYIVFGSIGLLVVIAIAYFTIMKKLDKGDAKYAKQLKAGTERNKFSFDVLYMKLYVIYLKIPGLKDIF